MQTKTGQTLRRLCMVAVFGAMAYVVMLFIHIPISFLTLDLKDTLIALCGLYFGPLAALSLVVLVPLLEFLTVSGTGIYGLIMNIAGSALFCLPLSLIYHFKKDLFGAIVGLLTSVFTMVGGMLLLNLWITPYYTGMTVAGVAGMIPKLLFPFNLVKAVLNAGLVLLLYKRLSAVLRKAGVLPRSMPRNDGAASSVQVENAVKARKLLGIDLRSAVISIIAVTLIAAAFVVAFAVLGGHLELGVAK